MKNKCAKQIAFAAGRELTKAELDSIEERMFMALRDMSLRNNDAFMRMSFAQRRIEAAKIAKDLMLKDVARAHDRAIQNAAQKNNLISSTRSQKAGINGQSNFLKQKIFEVDEIKDAIMAEWLSKLTVLAEADKGKWLNFIQDPENGLQIEKAMRGEPSTPEAQAAAKQIKETYAQVVERYQREGLPLNVLEDRTGPQTLDASRVRMHGGEAGSGKKDGWQFVEDFMSWLDKRAFVHPSGVRMTDDDIRKMLYESYETIGADGADANRRAAEKIVTSPLVAGATRNAPRRFFYKDAASKMAAMEKYGVSQDFMIMMYSDLNGMAKDIALTKVFGRTAEANFNAAWEIAAANDRAAMRGVKSERLQAKAEAVINGAKTLFQAALHPDRAGNVFAGGVHNQVRGYLSASLQAGGFISAFLDFPGSLGLARVSNISRARLLAVQLENFFAGKDKKQELASLGVWFDAMQTAQNKIVQDQLKYSVGQLFSSVAYRSLLLARWDMAARTANQVEALSKVAGLLAEGKTFEQAQKEFDAFGMSANKGAVTKEHYAIWSLANRIYKLKGFLGTERSLIRAEDIHDIPDDKMMPLVEERAAQRSDAIRAEIEKRNAQTEREKGWLEQRMKKFNELRDRKNRVLREFDDRRQKYDAKKDKATERLRGWLEGQLDRFDKTRNIKNRLLREFDERRQKSIDEANEMADAKAETLKAEVERAEIEHDIAGYLKTETSQARIKRFLERVEDGANVERQLVKERDHPDRMPDAVVERYQRTESIGERAERTIEDYGRSINRAAEALGARRARAEARIKAAEKRVADLQKEHEAEVQRRADALAKQFDDIRESLDDEAKGRLKEIEKRFETENKQHDKEVQRRANELEQKYKPILKEIQDSRAEYKERAAKRAEYAKEFEARAGKVLGEELMKAKDEAATALVRFGQRYMQMAVAGSAPTRLQDRYRFGLLTNPEGTVLGEGIRYGGQFIFTMMRPFLMQLEIANDSPRLNNGKWPKAAKAAYLAKFAAASFITQAFVTQLFNILGGKDPENMDPATEEGRKFWTRVSLRSGGLGPFGDALALGQNSRGQQGIEAMLGPGYGTAVAAVRTAFDVPTKLIEGEPGKAGLSAFKFVDDNLVPFSNAWYSKWAWDRLVSDNISEMLDPGIVAKRQQRLKNMGTSYWWERTETLPDRAPDFSKAYEE